MATWGCNRFTEFMTAPWKWCSVLLPLLLMYLIARSHYL